MSRYDHGVEEAGGRSGSDTARRFLRYLSRRPAESWAFFAVGVLLGAFFG